MAACNQQKVRGEQQMLLAVMSVVTHVQQEQAKPVQLELSHAQTSDVHSRQCSRTFSVPLESNTCWDHLLTVEPVFSAMFSFCC